MIKIFTLFFLLASIQSQASEKSVYEVISNNDNLSEFHKYLKFTGLDSILKKNYLGDGQYLLQIILLLKNLRKRITLF